MFCTKQGKFMFCCIEFNCVCIYLLWFFVQNSSKKSRFFYFPIFPFWKKDFVLGALKWKKPLGFQIPLSNSASRRSTLFPHQLDLSPHSPCGHKSSLLYV
jgi:hypothetical protein